MSEPENIVSFHNGEMPPWTMRNNREWCEEGCRRVYVVEKTRMLECQHCKRTIDPFDFIMRKAREADQCFRSLTGLDADIRKKTAELSDLNRDIANAKARLKRALSSQTE
jgi:hypothetical protein